MESNLRNSTPTVASGRTFSKIADTSIFDSFIKPSDLLHSELSSYASISIRFLAPLITLEWAGMHPNLHESQ